jgi:chemotaxis protein MotB
VDESSKSGTPSAQNHVANSVSLYDQWHVEAPADNDEESWLIIYLDVITLLLVFFVVLMTMMDWGDGGKGGPTAQSGAGYRHSAPPGTAGNDLAAEAEPTANQFADDAFGSNVEVMAIAGVVRLRINSEILFASGEAELTTQGLAVISGLAAALVARREIITVEGHTDTVAIETTRFPSNWELSTARATRVVRALIASDITPDRLRATGYADTRPIADNATPEGRSLNRRVELLLEDPPG